ncbi:hypothetical protein [Sphingomonas pokkalii]|uniref:hypothetical protein n=1 Tax=Sphingomonas pokkalii TaxID=2175090 RepID=UPI0019D2DDDF|nr:hypothetical protein [Sphingomonas pokkalii]
MQDRFSWSGVALSALSGAVSGGLAKVNVFGKGAEGLAGIGNVAARGALGSVISQGIAVATGLQPSFNWVGVAAAGIGAAATGSIRLGGPAGLLARNAAGGLANAAARSVLEGSDFGDNVVAALPDIIGNTIGNLVARSVAGGGRGRPGSAATPPQSDRVGNSDPVVGASVAGSSSGDGPAPQRPDLAGKRGGREPVRR